MKNRFFFYLLLPILLGSCSEKKAPLKVALENKPIPHLPAERIVLQSMNDFKTPDDNWKIEGAVYVDRTKKNTMHTTEGSGVLVNMPSQQDQGHLSTAFDHGDIEFECDLMLAVGSESAIYFQSRYGLRLRDSWGVKKPDAGNMGTIYQHADTTIAKSQQEYQGSAPVVNAAKSPGLWQHLKVVFHAPRFDATGAKTKHARFVEVQLNGATIHSNIEVQGPTLGGVGTQELAMAPLLIASGQGPIAFRNITYKLFGDRQVAFSELVMSEYDNDSPLFPKLDSLTAIREVQTDSVSATMATGVRPQKLLRYSGKLAIPTSGEYLFELKLNRAGGAVLIANDTLLSMNGNYSLDSIGLAKISLKKGEVPFQLIYNKHVPWQRGFGLFVEGPGVQRHALHAKGSLLLPKESRDPNFMIAVDNETVSQRGFWMHEGEKRTHCIAVGSPEGIHYSYDLESGAVLQAWSGEFMDATKMWRSRGEKQLGEASGFTISLHGDVEFAVLTSDEVSWPERNTDFRLKQLGYKIDGDGIPIFAYRTHGSTVTHKIKPVSGHRGLQRELTIKGTTELWHKIADGQQIELLADGTYIVNNESYFIVLDALDLEVKIRKTDQTDELVVRIPPGEQHLQYEIIW